MLLALLRFVALVAPAVAILMQVVSNRESGEGLSVEFELLQIALSLIVLGGLIIGYQFILTVENTLTFVGILSIFVSLPFLAVAIWWRNLPAKLKPPETASPADSLGYLFFDVLPIVLVVVLPFGLQAGLYYAVGDALSAGVSFGIVAESQLFDGRFLILAVLSLISVKSASLAFEANGLPPENVSNAVSSVVFYFVVLGLVFGLFVCVPYLVAVGIRLYFGLPLIHPLFNLPHVWTILILFIVLRMQIEEDTDSDTVPDLET